MCSRVQAGKFSTLDGYELVWDQRRKKAEMNGATMKGGDPSKLPQSLRALFANFDTFMTLGRAPETNKLLLQSLTIENLPMQDMPCVEVSVSVFVLLRCTFSLVLC